MTLPMKAFYMLKRRTAKERFGPVENTEAAAVLGGQLADQFMYIHLNKSKLKVNLVQNLFF